MVDLIHLFKTTFKPLKLDNVREPDLKKLSDQVTTWLKAKYAGKCS